MDSYAPAEKTKKAFIRRKLAKNIAALGSKLKSGVKNAMADREEDTFVRRNQK